MLKAFKIHKLYSKFCVNTSVGKNEEYECEVKTWAPSPALPTQATYDLRPSVPWGNVE